MQRDAVMTVIKMDWREDRSTGFGEEWEEGSEEHD